VRKYLPASRNDASDWKSGKSVEEINKVKAAGGFVELIQWRAHRSHPVGMADDGYVLEWRNFDSGSNMFGGNADAKTHAPRFMWVEKKVGYKSITADQLRKGNHFLDREKNAVPFDANAGWKDGVWTVVMIRPLGLANDDDKSLKEGGVYNIGFGMHDDNITTRGHHVSFVKTIGFGAKASIEAVKLP
jgi:Ethylbenzene dehydrogenase